MSFSSSNQRHFATRFQKDRSAGQVRTRGHRGGWLERDNGQVFLLQKHLGNHPLVQWPIYGKIPRKYGQKYQKYGTFTYLHDCWILKISHWLVNYQGIPHFQTHLHILGPNVGVLATNVLSGSKNVEFSHGFCWLRPTAWLQLWRKTTKHG